MYKRASLVVTLFAALAAYSSIAAADGIAAAPLPDGALQVFVASNGRLLTAWKLTPDPNAGWTALTAFSPPSPLYVTDVTVGRLPDARLQLFAVTTSGLITSWKQTSDPGSPWTNWTAFP